MRISVLVAFLILSATLGFAQTTEGLMAEWEISKERYAGVCESHKQNLLKVLKSLEERSRENGKVDDVRRIREEAAAFELDGTLPKSVKTTNYARDMALAGAQLRIAAQQIKGKLLKAGQDADAELVEQELQDLAPVQERSITGEDRTYWVTTEVPGSRFFTRRKDGTWFEGNRGKRTALAWQETLRTDDIIKLEDVVRRSAVVLSNDQCEITKYQRQVETLSGKWVTERELAEIVKTGKLPAEDGK